VSNLHICQILIDGKDRDAVDNDGNVLPTLVYMAREKRPQYHHNFKAGAMNALVHSNLYQFIISTFTNIRKLCSSH
jgi:hypothetical protein